MKSTLLVMAAVMILPLVSAAADITDVTGTWSGNWAPKGGVLDALTIEIRMENGKLAGKFRTPIPMDLTNISFNAKSGAVTLEATDPKSNKRYKLDGKLTGNDIKGTLVAGDVSGDVLLIKWTYIPR